MEHGAYPATKWLGSPACVLSWEHNTGTPLHGKVSAFHLRVVDTCFRTGYTVCGTGVRGVFQTPVKLLKPALVLCRSFPMKLEVECALFVPGSMYLGG